LCNSPIAALPHVDVNKPALNVNKLPLMLKVTCPKVTVMDVSSHSKPTPLEDRMASKGADKVCPQFPMAEPPLRQTMHQQLPQGLQDDVVHNILLFPKPKW